jgi:predicted nucleic acid-binding protein
VPDSATELHICVDASLAVKWGRPEVGQDVALRLYIDWMQQGRILVAPPIWLVEVCNALRQAEFDGDLQPDDAARALGAILSARVRILPFKRSTARRAYQLAARFGRKLVNDFCYLALAEQSRCEFWTADDNLAERVKPHFNFVRSLSTDA